MSDDCPDLNGPYQRCSIYRSKAESMGRTHSDPIAPAGMVNSTVNDMLKWVQFHLSDGVAAGKLVISRACMTETKLAISAAVALVAANPNITEADCDGFLMMDDQGKEMKGGFTYDGCNITLSETPGLGIEIDM